MHQQSEPATAAVDSTAPDTVNTMTQDVFNWIARSVNKEFVHLGYPTILTKKGSRDFVSLCTLMQNCSALLAVVKAKAGADQQVATAADPQATAGPGNKGGRASSSQQQQQAKKRSGGLFSSRSFKQMQQLNAESHARLVAEVPRAMNFDSEFGSIYEGIIETVRRDTETVIEATRCLPEPETNDQPQDQQLLLFFTTRWVQFKEAVTRRLLEAGQLTVEVQSLRTSGGRCWTSGGGQQRSKSASGDAGLQPQSQQPTDGSESDCADIGKRVGGGPIGSRPRPRSLSRHRAWSDQQAVSVTKIPALEAEIRRLKLDLTRRDQRHKEELGRQAKERERQARDFRLAQRRTPGPMKLAFNGQQQHSQQPASNQQHSQLSTSERTDQVLTDVCQALNRLAGNLGHQQQQQQRLTSPSAGSRKQQQQQQIHEYADSICNAALARIQGLQTDCQTSRRRQADLEVLISILKARLDLTNDQLSDVAKFESAVNDIAKRLPSDGGSLQPPPPPQRSQGGGDELLHRDSLVSRLTSRLRERQRAL